MTRLASCASWLLAKLGAVPAAASGARLMRAHAALACAIAVANFSEGLSLRVNYPRPALASLSRPAHVQPLVLCMGLFDFLDPSANTVPDGYAIVSHLILLGEGEEESQADEILARIQSGELSFEAAARTFSACPTRDLNGYIGTISSLAKAGSVSFLGLLPCV